MRGGALRSARMFEGLCYANGSQWHGISYKGGGLSTHHGGLPTLCRVT